NTMAARTKPNPIQPIGLSFCFRKTHPKTAVPKIPVAPSTAYAIGSCIVESNPQDLFANPTDWVAAKFAATSTVDVKSFFWHSRSGDGSGMR
ncbi:MAG: hypothetical protein ABL921_25515, partial [Pirellula sp.]